MNDRDIVKLTIFSKSGGSYSVITSREKANQFREDVMTNANISGWYEIEGKLDHINANNTVLAIDYEDIIGFDITEVNQI